MTSVSIAPVPVDEFLEMPDPDPADGHFELINGSPILMPPVHRPHFVIQMSVLKLLFAFAESRGAGATEFPFQPSPDQNSFFIADYGFVSKQRWDTQSGPYFLGAPDLTVEVKSPGNSWDVLAEKRRICLNHGCLLFWIIDPKYKEVHVTDATNTTRVYSGEMTIRLEPVFDTAINVRDLFPQS